MICPKSQISPQGPSLSRIVAGMWRIGDWHMNAQLRLQLIEQCIALGVTSFDHADIYGNYTAEALFGEALALAPALRSQIELVSKCDIKLLSNNRPEHGLKYYDTSAAHITASVDQSLQSLRTDYLDLLLIHRPDPLMNFDEMAQTWTTTQQGPWARNVAAYLGVSVDAPLWQVLA